MAHHIKRPTYTLTRSAFWMSFWFTWGFLAALLVGALCGLPQAVPLAGIAFPSLVTLLAALLGIHRLFGSQDLRTQASLPAPPVDTEKEGG